MPIHPAVVSELRALFRAGATPSALVRRVAERHTGEPATDALVRAYFREAFRVPMVHIGPEQVRQAAAGGALPALNVTVLPRMVEARPGWDDTPGGWLDAVAPAEPADPQQIPELARCWDQLDDAGREYVTRLLTNARAAHAHIAALAALAEALQQQAASPVHRAVSA